MYSLPVMMCCFVIMVGKGFSVRALWNYLKRDDLDAVMIREVVEFPDGNIPNRRTFDRRLSKWSQSAITYIEAAIRWFTIKKLIGVARLALDRRMFNALGKLWHSKDQKLGIIPKGLRNVDKDASWSKSHYRGWVFGHGLDVIVTVGKLVLPVLASAVSLKIHENQIAKRLVKLLPKVKKGSMGGDYSYHDPELKAMLALSGRSLQAAGRKGQLPKGKTYRRRKVTVEPFFERLLLAFPHLQYKLPVKGETRVAGHLLTAVFLYQVAVILNVVTKKPPLEVTHLIQFL